MFHPNSKFQAIFPAIFLSLTGPLGSRFTWVLPPGGVAGSGAGLGEGWGRNDFHLVRSHGRLRPIYVTWPRGKGWVGLDGGSWRSGLRDLTVANLGRSWKISHGINLDCTYVKISYDICTSDILGHPNKTPNRNWGDLAAPGIIGRISF